MTCMQILVLPAGLARRVISIIWREENKVILTVPDILG